MLTREKRNAQLFPASDSNHTLMNLHWQVELERIDREWEKEKEKFRAALRQVQRWFPSRRTKALYILSIVGGYLLSVAGVTKIENPSSILLFSVIIMAYFIVCARVEAAHHANFEKARDRYEKQRTEHLQQRPT